MPNHHGSRALRTLVALLVATSLAFTACGGSKSTTSSPTTVAADGKAIGNCQNVGTKVLAKTRFVVAGGLAFGAFHRYIYKPLKNGGFTSGADGRVKAFVKAGAAAIFVLHSLGNMKDSAESDKNLCKLVPSVDGITNSLKAFAAKMKGGTADEADLDGVSGTLDQLKAQASPLGVNLTDSNAPIPGLS